MAIPSEFFDRYVETHLADNVSSDRTPPAYEMVIQHLPRDRQTNVLEIGCGSGGFIDYASSRGYTSILGIDISPQQVQKARDDGLNNKILCESALSHLAERDSVYDVIVGLDFLEHIPKADVLDTLKAARHSLVPGGKLVLRTPNAASPFFGEYRYGDFTHEFCLTPRSARQVLRSANFENVCVYEVPPIAHGAKSAARAVGWRVLRSIIALAFALQTGVMGGQVLTMNMIVTAARGYSPA